MEPRPGIHPGSEKPKSSSPTELKPTSSEQLKGLEAVELTQATIERDETNTQVVQYIVKGKYKETEIIARVFEFFKDFESKEPISNELIKLAEKIPHTIKLRPYGFQTGRANDKYQAVIVPNQEGIN